MIYSVYFPKKQKEQIDLMLEQVEIQLLLKDHSNGILALRSVSQMITDNDLNKNIIIANKLNNLHGKLYQIIIEHDKALSFFEEAEKITEETIG